MIELGKVLLAIDQVDVGQHKQTLMKSYVRRLDYFHLDLDIDLIKLSNHSISELQTMKANLKSIRTCVGCLEPLNNNDCCSNPNCPINGAQD